MRSVITVVITDSSEKLHSEQGAVRRASWSLFHLMCRVQRGKSLCDEGRDEAGGGAAPNHLPGSPRACPKNQALHSADTHPGVASVSVPKPLQRAPPPTDKGLPGLSVQPLSGFLRLTAELDLLEQSEPPLPHHHPCMHQVVWRAHCQHSCIPSTWRPCEVGSVWSPFYL